MANSKLLKSLESGEARDEWVKVVGGRALVPNSDYVGRAMKYFGDIDPKISYIVDKCVTVGDVCLDIGANLGLVSLRMSKRVGPAGVVHAFEPQPRMQSYIRRTLSENNITNISLHGVALGEQPDALKLSIPKGNAGAASLAVDAGGDAEQIEVPVYRLTDFMEKLGVGAVSFVKIDVEGFEPFVIKGGQDFLSEAKPNVIVLEEHGAIADQNLPESLRLLANLGYHIYALPKAFVRVRLDADLSGSTCHDYVAVSDTAPEALRSKLGV